MGPALQSAVEATLAPPSLSVGGSVEIWKPKLGFGVDLI